MASRIEIGPWRISASCIAPNDLKDEYAVVGDGSKSLLTARLDTEREGNGPQSSDDGFELSA